MWCKMRGPPVFQASLLRDDVFFGVEDRPRQVTDLLAVFWGEAIVVRVGYNHELVADRAVGPGKFPVLCFVMNFRHVLYKYLDFIGALIYNIKKVVGMKYGN